MAEYEGDITPQQAWEMLLDNPAAVLVDVRTEAEWRFVGVPDTSETGREPLFVEWINYPGGAPNHGFLEELADAGIVPDTGAPLLFLCRSGQRSMGAAAAATAAGMGPAYNILDGFEGGPDVDGHRGVQGWKAAGLPWRQG
ncbi:rhodanese-like domain-containing protein [Demequina sp. TTPB684]|uniref:rhodanese-like domain-containing protein n=1 Tax=unclassified Demequina TaxID=2620311 RepID=UPI001CF43EBE|nr:MULTISPECIES: rhodanese-like domain-containing protein [unclassified Demequina]MCB2411494.1 rhodanese-like domain-containing protein [Demequina sp. TTPB684]UPU87636.1 rhodanese-like domain-containing protein [Demequina sp. TMPB413]